MLNKQDVTFSFQKLARKNSADPRWKRKAGFALDATKLAHFHTEYVSLHEAYQVSIDP